MWDLDKNGVLLYDYFYDSCPSSQSLRSLALGGRIYKNGLRPD